MRAVCRGVARLGVGGMLFGHWFPPMPSALCCPLRGTGSAWRLLYCTVVLHCTVHCTWRLLYCIVLFERFRTISICYHFLHVAHISLSNITTSNILLELKCFNLVMVVSGGLGRTTSNLVGCWQPQLGRNYCLQLIQG